MITQKELKKILNYNPDTGIFTWLIRPSQSVRSGSIAGHIEVSGYSRIRINKKMHSSHRLAFLYMLGYFPKNYADHINGNRSDNRWSNLREATRQQNQCNQKLSSRNTSGYKGVVWVEKRNKWRAMISMFGTMKHIGHYDNVLDAAKAYEDAARNHHGAFYREMS